MLLQTKSIRGVYLEGDEAIYLSQPNRKFEPTSYKQRVARVLGLDYKELQERISREEIMDRIATGLIDDKTGERMA